MDATNLPTAELDDLLRALMRPSALTELGVLAAVLLLAWLVVRVVRGPRRPVASVWLGDHLVDGVLFPMLALALAYAAEFGLRAAGVPLGLFRVVVPVLVSLLLIRLAARVLQAAFPNSRWAQAVERSVSWLAWLAMVLWVTNLMPAVLHEMELVHWKVGNAQMSLRTLVEGTLTVGLVLVLVLWLAAVIERKLLAGPVEDLSLRKIAANLVRASLVLIGLLMALSAVGIDLTALSVLGGALGVGLGLGLQKLAANYVSGFVILAERSLRIGDMVKVDTFEGRITDIATRYTIIRALNGREAIVPNELLISQRVENSSLADQRVAVTTTVQVGYDTDLPTLFPELVATVSSVTRVLQEPAPQVQLTAFAADGLELTIPFWIGDPENGTGSVRSAVNLAILDLLNRRGVVIPYPQRVVHRVGTADTPPVEPPQGNPPEREM